MKLRALRLKSFRRFGGAVEIANFGDGLNVLCGPNEMGKSTIFHALEAAFLSSYRQSGAPLDMMRPHGGGDPCVEVDFEAGGALWRIAKQFGRGKSATLFDISGSLRQIASGGDAEDRLGELAGLNGEGPARLGLVWVRQQRTLLAPDPDFNFKTGKLEARGEANALIEAVGREVDAVAGGESVARVTERVKAALSILMQDKRSGARKNGPLDLARGARAEIQLRLDQSRQIAAAAEDRLRRIAELQARSDEIDRPGWQVTEDQQLQLLDKQIAAAAALRAQLAVAREAHRSRLLELEAAQTSHRALSMALSELSQLSAEAVLAEHTKSELTAELLRLEKEDDAAGKSIAAVAAELAQTAEHLAAVDRFALWALERDRAGQLQSAYATAERLETGIAALAAQIDADPATPERIALMTSQINVIAVGEAELSAGAPVVEIVLQPGASGRVRLDGAPVIADTSQPVAGHLDIAIDGIANIRVSAANGTRLRDTSNRVEAAKRALGDLLAAMGSHDAGNARARAAARTETCAKLNSERATLAAFAPAGCASLASDLQRRLQDLGAGPQQPEFSKADLQNRQAVLFEKRNETERRRSQTVQKKSVAEKNLAGTEASMVARANRLLALQAVVPSELKREEALAEAERTFNAAQDILKQSAQRFEILNSNVLTDDDFRALSQTLEAKRDDIKRREQQCRALTLEIEKLKSEQSAIDEDGRAGQVDAVSGDLAQAQAQVDRLELEVKALGLLGGTLNAAYEGARRQYLEPVARCLAPYLARVFPDAGVAFTGDFALDALTRAGAREDFASLSDGTREQLAVLVRMAFARLICESGKPAPLILDDPLVYSDDARLDAMCRALEDAACVHQVVLLTCREAAFKNLSGHRLDIRSWQPD